MYLYPRIWADSEKPCENWAFMGNHPSPIISLPWFHFHHSSFTRLGFAVAYELDTLVEGEGRAAPRERNESTRHKPSSRSCCRE